MGQYSSYGGRGILGRRQHWFLDSDINVAWKLELYYFPKKFDYETPDALMSSRDFEEACEKEIGPAPVKPEMPAQTEVGGNDPVSINAFEEQMQNYLKNIQSYNERRNELRSKLMASARRAAKDARGPETPQTKDEREAKREANKMRWARIIWKPVKDKDKNVKVVHPEKAESKDRRKNLDDAYSQALTKMLGREIDWSSMSNKEKTDIWYKLPKQQANELAMVGAQAVGGYTEAGREYLTAEDVEKEFGINPIGARPGAKSGFNKLKSIMSIPSKTDTGKTIQLYEFDKQTYVVEKDNATGEKKKLNQGMTTMQMGPKAEAIAGWKDEEVDTSAHFTSLGKEYDERMKEWIRPWLTKDNRSLGDLIDEFLPDEYKHLNFFGPKGSTQGVPDHVKKEVMGKIKATYPDELERIFSADSIKKTIGTRGSGRRLRAGDEEGDVFKQSISPYLQGMRDSVRQVQNVFRNAVNQIVEFEFDLPGGKKYKKEYKLGDYAGYPISRPTSDAAAALAKKLPCKNCGHSKADHEDDLDCQACEAENVQFDKDERVMRCGHYSIPKIGEQQKKEFMRNFKIAKMDKDQVVKLIDMLPDLPSKVEKSTEDVSSVGGQEGSQNWPPTQQSMKQWSDEDKKGPMKRGELKQSNVDFGSAVQMIRRFIDSGYENIRKAIREETREILSNKIRLQTIAKIVGTEDRKFKTSDGKIVTRKVPAQRIPRDKEKEVRNAISAQVSEMWPDAKEALTKKVEDAGIKDRFTEIFAALNLASHAGGQLSAANRLDKIAYDIVSKGPGKGMEYTPREASATTVPPNIDIITKFLTDKLGQKRLEDRFKDKFKIGKDGEMEIDYSRLTADDKKYFMSLFTPQEEKELKSLLDNAAMQRAKLYVTVDEYGNENVRLNPDQLARKYFMESEHGGFDLNSIKDPKARERKKNELVQKLSPLAKTFYMNCLRLVSHQSYAIPEREPSAAAAGIEAAPKSNLKKKAEDIDRLEAIVKDYKNRAKFLDENPKMWQKYIEKFEVSGQTVWNPSLKTFSTENITDDVIKAGPKAEAKRLRSIADDLEDEIEKLKVGVEKIQKDPNWKPGGELEKTTTPGGKPAYVPKGPDVKVEPGHVRRSILPGKETAVDKQVAIHRGRLGSEEREKAKQDLMAKYRRPDYMEPGPEEKAIEDSEGEKKKLAEGMSSLFKKIDAYLSEDGLRGWWDDI